MYIHNIFRGQVCNILINHENINHLLILKDFDVYLEKKLHFIP